MILSRSAATFAIFALFLAAMSAQARYKARDHHHQYHKKHSYSNTNVYGDTLEVCSKDPMTGWLRTGKCTHRPNDHGTHVVCAVMTKEFLKYTKKQGNDLSTPSSYFPGLKPGDRWCLCAVRWKQAWNHVKKTGANSNIVPKVVLGATQADAVHYVDMKILEDNAHDRREL